MNSFITLAGVFLGGIITLIATIIQGKFENKRSKQRVESEEYKLELQLVEERSKVIADAKRISYSQCLPILNESLVAILDGKIYPNPEKDEEIHRYHSAISSLMFLGNKEISKIAKDFFKSYPTILEESKRLEVANTLKILIGKIIEEMKIEIGIE